MATRCFKCQKILELPVGVNFLRTESCPYCRWDLHCCKMCLFYDTSAYNECKESQAERVVEKEKSNFCDFFRAADENQTDSSKAKDSKKSLLDAAKSLFKDP